MTVGIGAAGILGIALEVTAGTYVAPTKFYPFESESLAFTQETVWRRPIRQSADIVGATSGNSRVEGEISGECLEDVFVYFMHCARQTVAKTGTTDISYTFTPSAAAVPIKTMSITIVRNGIVFAYTGCVVASYTLTVEDGALKNSFTILGRDESVQSSPTATWPTTVPFGAGTYTVEIPAATQVFDADGFEFSVDHSAEAQYRLKNTGRGAQFIKFGENSVQLTTERDFESRTEYDAFKALTSQAIKVLASKGTNNQVQIDMPVTVKDAYTVGTGGQGDLIRASITYNGVIDATGKSYTVTVKTQENIT